MTVIDEARLKRIEAFRSALVDRLNLPKNVEKSDWRDITLAGLISLMRRELWELESAHHEHVIAEVLPEGMGTRRAIADEALDVAAFAFMLWDVITTSPQELRGRCQNCGGDTWMLDDRNRDICCQCGIPAEVVIDTTAPLCSICRRRHGPEVRHEAE